MAEHLVTGATGLLGSHIAEQLVRQGCRVRALVRPQSDVSFLKHLGVSLCRGDLGDAASLRSAVEGCRVVYHAACKVGDWGPWEAFRRHAIEGTRNLLEACTAAGVRRFILVSSTSAYGHPPSGSRDITEDHPLGRSFWLWDYYTRAKVEAERWAWAYHRRFGLPLTVVRPSWLYGPRDRTSITRLARGLRQRQVLILGRGMNRLSVVYAGNVADACLRAAEHPAAVGQAYNITSDGVITQREFLFRLADALSAPRPAGHMFYPVAYAWAGMLEGIYRLLRCQHPPYVTRYAVWLLGRNTVYSTVKAQRELGWQPRITYAEGIRRTAEWFLSHERSLICGPARGDLF